MTLWNQASPPCARVNIFFSRDRRNESGKAIKLNLPINVCVRVCVECMFGLYTRVLGNIVTDWS